MTNNQPFRVAIIGTGRPQNADGSTGFGMAHAHAKGYNEAGCEIVALCDLVAERAEAFNQENAGGKATVYTDYTQMLAETKPDIVSVCTWPAHHAPMVLACAEANVRAVHCEKPMAPNYADSLAMANACRANGIQLTFNHQRRFNGPFAAAHRLIKAGAIGDVIRIESSCGNFFDWGTHWINMFLFFNNESPAQWVLAQTDARRPNTVFGAAMETQGVAVIKFENGVYATLYVGEESQQIVDCAIRVHGKNGVLEILWNAPWLRYKTGEIGAWQLVPDAEVADGIHGDDANTAGVLDVVDALHTGRTPLCSVDNALPTTEIIFAAYESARRRGRVDMPLQTGDNAFTALLAEGVYPEAVA
ncbi:MAG: Gfo/Idh/MocA family oxidoreductase [Armatimonadetes bacterium]|nr:Gfo/Idh/MocA family oxidoreductase [Armatimonadota bacterium]